MEDRPLILKGQKERYDRYVVFDLETTGLNHRQDRIIEIGAVKVEHGRITERFSQLVDPQIPLQPEIVSLTGITNSDLAGKPTIDKVLPAFLSFAEDCLLVAHNATFDVSFIRRMRVRSDCLFLSTVWIPCRLRNFYSRNNGAIDWTEWPKRWM